MRPFISFLSPAGLRAIQWVGGLSPSLPDPAKVDHGSWVCQQGGTCEAGRRAALRKGVGDSRVCSALSVDDDESASYDLIFGFRLSREQLEE
jgi:hypothetical protein